MKRSARIDLSADIGKLAFLPISDDLKNVAPVPAMQEPNTHRSGTLQELQFQWHDGSTQRYPVNMFVPHEKVRIMNTEVKMPTATQAEELVVWTQPKTLAEAKSLFAPYSPKFQTVPCNVRAALGKAWVSLLYLSSPEQDSAVESTLAILRSCKVSNLLVYTPHRSADFAFRVGTMVGRQ